MTVGTIKVKDKEREIAILNCKEKEIRAELGRKLCSKITFPNCVYSYIKGKSINQAITDIKNNMDDFTYFMKCDIKEYFKSINTDILLRIIKERCDSKILCKSIEDVLIEDKNNYASNGLILGSPLSNHLSNLYLIDIDEEFELNKNIKYYRFCDDMFFLYNNEEDVVTLTNKLNDLKLKLNEDKIFKGSYGDSVEYLGTKITKIKEPTELKGLTHEEVLYLFKEKKENLKGTTDIENFKNWVYSNLKKEYEYIFRYYFQGEDKDILMEEMLDENYYREVYIFEDALLTLDDEKNIFNIFKEKFLGYNERYYLYEYGDSLEYKEINSPIDEELLKNHLNGEISLAINLNYEEKSKILVLDIDNKNNLKKAKELAVTIQNDLENSGIISYLEFSGNKGYHLWILFDDYVDIRKLNIFVENVINRLNIKRDLVEIIPKYNKLSYTQDIIKLPLGVHPLSKNKSYFSNINSIKEMIPNSFEDKEDILNTVWNHINEDFSDIYKVANNCEIIKKIINYGILKGHMNHFNRLILTYVFPKLENGEDFLHFIMENLNNYSHNITSKWISKAPEHTISCRKLREYFKNTDFICTNCKFDNVGTYDSPILHSKNEEMILFSTKNQVKDIVDELIRLQQEKKELVMKIKKLEKKLNVIYEELGGESIDISIGKLNKNEEKWIIEIEV